MREPDVLTEEQAAEMSDRELLLHVVRESISLRRQWVLAMHYLHSVNLELGRKAEAQEIKSAIHDEAGERISGVPI